MKKILIFLFICLAGCSGYLTNYIRLGMGKSDVLGILGDPKSTSAIDDIEYLRYGDNYFVRLKDGKVNAYGKIGDFGTSVPEETINLNINKTDEKK
jgi:hypothetical protein